MAHGWWYSLRRRRFRPKISGNNEKAAAAEIPKKSTCTKTFEKRFKWCGTQKKGKKRRRVAGTIAHALLKSKTTRKYPSVV